MNLTLKEILVFVLVACLFSGSLAAQQDEAMQAFVKAEHLRKSKRFVPAIDEYDRAISLKSDDPKFHFFRAVCFFMLKDYHNAILGCQQTVQLKADFAPAHTMMAQSYQQLEKTEEMVAAMALAAKYETNPAKKIGLLGSVIGNMLELGKTEQAMAQVQEGLRTVPDNPEMLYYQAVIFNKRGQFQDASLLMEKATAKIGTYDPKRDAKFYYELGYAYNRLGNFEKSSQAFDKANVGPFKPLIAKLSPRFFTNAAIAYLQIYDFDACLENLQEALRIQSNFSPAFVIRANLETKLANQQNAIKYLNNALQHETDQNSKAALYENLVGLQMNNKRYEDAIASADQYLQINPKNYEINFVKGMAQYKRKDYGNALATLKGLIDWHGLDKETLAKYHFALGLVYRDLKDYHYAKLRFKDALAGPYRMLAEVELEKLQALPEETAQ